MAVRPLFVPTAALCGLGAVLLLVPPFSASLPALLSVPLLAFWLFTWYLDACFTAKHWRFVGQGCEANVLVLALARIAPRRPGLVFAAHSAFSLGAALGLQVLVTRSLDYFLLSCILVIFGILHVDGLYRSRMFVRKVQGAEEQKVAGTHLR